MQGPELAREARHQLPGLLATLLDRRAATVEVSHGDRPDCDLEWEIANRSWVAVVKTSSGPGTISKAAKQLKGGRGRTPGRVVRILVVPHMTPAGAKAAAAAELNWIDLSGNAHIRDQGLYVHVEGRPSRFRSPGRPATPFAPKSARLTRVLLVDPARWWRQVDLAEETGLDDGQVSRVVRRLSDEDLLDHRAAAFRPRDPDVLLDAWADSYRFDKHDIVTAHVSGAGPDLTAELQQLLSGASARHAFTGLPAAWVLGRHARFRLASVYVEGDPRDVLEEAGMRRGERGANVQLIGPDDDGVFAGTRDVGGIPIVSPPQVYLDLLALPERAGEAAEQLREDRLLWDPRG